MPANARSAWQSYKKIERSEKFFWNFAKRTVARSPFGAACGCPRSGSGVAPRSRRDCGATYRACGRWDILYRPAWNRRPIENIKFKLTTKSQVDIRLPEQKYSDANSRSFNVQPHLQQYQCCVPYFFASKSDFVCIEVCPNYFSVNHCEP